ncbi:hypothetical protein K0038_01251 [Pseudomonas syringae]|uniref:eCIS core domain-containing protein n=1 Tax=Pseudomonas syringae TaxID=317 RepID=UPI001CA9F2CD|nr:DUF4157 domain-containing protein [Pseudomonas syringae]MCI3944243.1 hypothetical protein [Pseudomonas syringae]
MSEFTPQRKKQSDTTKADAVHQRQSAAVLQDNRPSPVQAKAAPTPNRTGMPDTLKSGIESLSGMSMDHVKVHYNSDKPAQLHAHAYAQGSDIHLAPGQEKHLPHEAWHVVQQAQGRVRPTVQMKGGANVNDDAGLEREADVMGHQALQQKSGSEQNSLLSSEASGPTVVQRVVIEGGMNFDAMLKAYDFSPAGLAILTNWEASPTLHSFKKGKFLEALEAAVVEKARASNENDQNKLFSQANHKFSTQAEGRLPTLYFNTEDHARSGRLRQQHRSGPLAKANAGAHSDYFFEHKADAASFKEALKMSNDKQSVIDKLSSDYNGVKDAKHGYFHVESSESGSGLPHGSVHLSGGHVVLNGGEHDDQAIDNIHKQIIGESH